MLLAFGSFQRNQIMHGADPVCVDRGVRLHLPPANRSVRYFIRHKPVPIHVCGIPRALLRTDGTDEYARFLFGSAPSALGCHGWERSAQEDPMRGTGPSVRRHHSGQRRQVQGEAGNAWQLRNLADVRWNYLRLQRSLLHPAKAASGALSQCL